jgi:hypothetical protein
MRVIIKFSVHFNMMIYLLVNTVIYAFGRLTSSTEKRQANNCDLPVTLTGNLFATNTLHSKTIYKSQVIAAANSKMIPRSSQNH